MNFCISCISCMTRRTFGDALSGGRRKSASLASSEVGWLATTRYRAELGDEWPSAAARTPICCHGRKALGPPNPTKSYRADLTWRAFGQRERCVLPSPPSG
jgi:hypothetical protein